MALGTDRREALRALAGEIAATLARGLPQDRASLETVLVALGETDIRTALARLAADPEASEHAPLMALLLSPDPWVLRGLESALARADVDAREALELAELVVQRLANANHNADTTNDSTDKPGDTSGGRSNGKSCGAGRVPLRGSGRVPVLLPVRLPDGSLAELSASADGLRAFVRRLRPEATAPADLRALLARRCDPELAVELAVLLRHCRLAWTPERVFFLATLLERAKPDVDDLPGLTAWATGFLEDSGLKPELRRALAERRQALLAQLRQAEFLDEALARGNYETLISQGLRFAHVHGPEVRAELAHLERAGWLALGLRGEALDGVSVRDLGRAEDARELLRLMPGLGD